MRFHQRLKMDLILVDVGGAGSHLAPAYVFPLKQMGELQGSLEVPSSEVVFLSMRHVYSHTTSCSDQKDPKLSLMLYCHCLEIHNISSLNLCFMSEI